MKKFEIDTETKTYELIISKQNRLQNPLSGCSVTDIDSISIFSGNFDIETNISIETNLFRISLVQMVQTLRKQFFAPVCFRVKLGQVQAWVHDP